MTTTKVVIACLVSGSAGVLMGFILCAVMTIAGRSDEYLGLKEPVSPADKSGSRTNNN
jgi:hypothetical protein